MLLFIMVSGFKYVISYKSIRKIAYTFFKLNDETGEHIITQGKKIAITSFISAVLFASSAFAIERENVDDGKYIDFFNHRFIGFEAIGPAPRTDLILDQEKVAQTKSSEENFRLPSGINPVSPSVTPSNATDPVVRKSY